MPTGQVTTIDLDDLELGRIPRAGMRDPREYTPMYGSRAQSDPYRYTSAASQPRRDDYVAAPALMRAQTVMDRYGLSPAQRNRVNRRVSSQLQRRYGMSGLGQTASTDWVQTINDMGESYYKLKPYVDFFADHPFLSAAVILAVAGSIVGIYSWLGAAMRVSADMEKIKERA